ncbi:MAG: porin [Massilia sp.]|nr:porin [Massilia sp.]
MKKIIIAAAILGAFAATAQAQSNVAIYGILDAGIVHESGGTNGNLTKVGSGISSASRFGFRGTEDLGNGLSALFTLEGGVKIDTGIGGAGIFDRQSFVGLKSTTLGTVTIGRQYTLLYLALGQVADPFGVGYSGSARGLFPSVGNATRTSNTVMYASPKMSGFSADLAYSAGEQAGSNVAGRQIGADVAYSNGPLNARLVYNAINNDTAAVSNDIGRNTMFAANYDFVVAKAFFAYSDNKGMNSSALPNAIAYTTPTTPVAASTDSTNLLIGATVPVGPAGTVMASYIRKNDKNVANRDADQFAIGYSYALSKRTNAYTSFAKIKNKNGASYTVGDNTDAGSGDKAFSVGVRHSF